jgi:ABC-type multidrug transport system ATPase subunit
MLKIKDLIKVFPGPVAALRGVSLEIGDGLFGLLGPNGAGKSTLMGCITGGVVPTSGIVLLDGHDVIANPQFVRDRLGYLPQDFGLYPELSGAAMLDLLLQLKGIGPTRARRDMVDALLEQVNLRHAAKRRVSTYSGGMRQRLGIAQAIAGSPRLIVLDEPTAGLDPAERNRLYELLSELGRDRIIILSTHIVEDVSTVCSRFAIISNGLCAMDGLTADARRSLDGRIHEGIVDRREGSEIESRLRVTSRSLVEGTRLQLRVSCDAIDAPPGFSIVPATLADAYFMTVQDDTPKAAR